MSKPAPADQHRTALARAELIGALWAKPVVSYPEAVLMSGLPASTFAVLRRRGDGPPMFNYGKSTRRVFARTADLRAWIERQTTKTA